jgi:hypothetical protein
VTGGQRLVHLEPYRKDPASSNFISEFRPGGFLHAPPCWLASSHMGFPLGITRERCLKPPGLDLTGGALAPVWSYGEALALAGSHPRMGTQARLRSRFGTVVLSLRPLANSRAQGPCRLASPRKLSPFRLLKHVRTGSVHMH